MLGLEEREASARPVVLVWAPPELPKDEDRFSELQREIGNISQKGLTLSLRSLERDGFISRTSYATIPPRVDYALTALGVEALKAFEAFEAFAAVHWQSVLEARRLFDARSGEPPVAMIVQLNHNARA